MSDSLDPLLLPSDVCLLLRADAEQSWLHREVLPVLRDLENPDERDEQDLGAALAYLEAMWNEARARARHTDAAHTGFAQSAHEGPLPGHAGRYHAAVCTLREIVAARIAPLIKPSPEGRRGYRDSPPELLDKARTANGRTPQAA